MEANRPEIGGNPLRTRIGASAAPSTMEPPSAAR
jgi:hypothetical protein